MVETMIKVTDMLTESATQYLRVLLLCAKATSKYTQVRRRLASLDSFMQGQCDLQKALLEMQDDQQVTTGLNNNLAPIFLSVAIKYTQMQGAKVAPLASYLNWLLEIENEDKMAIIENTVFTVNTTNVTLACAQKLAHHAEVKAREINVPMSIAILDTGCNLVLHQRMEHALQTSINVALNKAYSAVSFKIPTFQLAPLVQPGAELYGIQHNDPKLAVFGGGFPIWIEGKLVGGLGVAGGTVDQDMHVARFALKQVLGMDV